MAINPYNNIDGALMQLPEDPYANIDGALPDNIEIVDDQTAEALPPEDLMGMEDSSVEMTEDGGAVVTLGPQPTDIDSIGFGDNLAVGMDESDLGLLSRPLPVD
jgi:hypothetical protein